MYHVVEFKQFEPNQGTDVWYEGYLTKEEAIVAEHEVNKNIVYNSSSKIYTSAYYKGIFKKIPESYIA